MKIALVSPYDFGYPGGVVNHITSLKRHLTRLGQEVKVIAPTSKYVSGMGDWFIPVGIPHPIPANGSIVRITFSVNLSSKIKETLEQEHFDIVHLHEPLMPFLCLTMLRVSESVNIGTFHANYKPPKYVPGAPLDGYNFARPISTMFLKKWIQNLDGRIAVSTPAMDFVNKHFPGEYEIIPNGVELEHFSPDVPPIDDFCDGKVNILFVGRMEKRKGFKYLLEAYSLVKQQLDNCRLIVVGPGTVLRSRYEATVLEEGIKDVVFVGYAPYEELPRFYRTADIFCAPATECESFGLILLEAMAVGKPIIASDIEGYTSLLTHGTEGLLVPPKDKEALATALLTLIKDKTLRKQMGANGILKAQDYSWENVTKKVLEYYKKTANEVPWQRQLRQFEPVIPRTGRGRYV